jgi:transposase
VLIGEGGHGVVWGKQKAGLAQFGATGRAVAGATPAQTARHAFEQGIPGQEEHLAVVFYSTKNRRTKEMLMVDDNTFMPAQSSGAWIVDWDGASCLSRRSADGAYDEIVIDVHRCPSLPRPGVPAGWKVHANGHEDIVLKHASTANTLILLNVHVVGWVAVGPDGKRHRIRERLPFRAGDKRYTLHFKAQVSAFMGGYGVTLKKCAKMCHTTPAIVKEINKARLFALAGDMAPLHPSRHIAIDEFLIAHGHRYCTIVIDADSGELLYLERGKSKQQAYHFFEWVGAAFMKGVEAVSMDMNTSYATAFSDEYPHVAIVYDGFHIIQWFNKQVIDSLRRTEANRLKKEAEKLARAGDFQGAAEIESERRLLFGQRWNLLANERTLRAKDALNAEINAEAKAAAVADGSDPFEVGRRRQDNAGSRKALLDANASLQCAVRAREELQDALRLTDAGSMRMVLTAWCNLYSKAGVSQLTRFTKTITRRLDGIVSRAIHRISSGVLEGTNTLIKNIRRQAFGLVDFDYFGLLVWEQTHKPNRRRRSHPPRPYHRVRKCNTRHTKQTIYRRDINRQTEAA